MGQLLGWSCPLIGFLGRCYRRHVVARRVTTADRAGIAPARTGIVPVLALASPGFLRVSATGAEGASAWLMSGMVDSGDLRLPITRKLGPR